MFSAIKSLLSPFVVLVFVLSFSGLAAASLQDIETAIMQKDYQKAYDLSQDFVGKKPSAPEALEAKYYLGLSELRLGKSTEARKLFNEILLREPSYVGSYYHLGKLLERVADFDRAIKVYKRGMEEAKKAGDNHSYNELQWALEDIEE